MQVRKNTSYSRLIQMEGTGKILRRTIHTFFQNYHYFSFIVILALPVSASLLLSHALVPANFVLHQTIQSRLGLLFEAAGFPASTDFFVALTVKLSQTIFSYTFTLPFSLTCLIVVKAFVIHIVCWCPRSKRLSLLLLSAVRLYPSLLATYICSSFAVLSANTAIFSLLLIVFNVAEFLSIISPNTIFILCTMSAFLYSIVLAHVTVSCNLAIVVSGVDNQGGYLPFFKAFLLIQQRAATALSLALLGNVSMASVEALFQYRVMKPYHMSNKLHLSFVWETLLIAYIHSLVIVLDVIATCVFFKSCNSNGLPRWELGSSHNFEILEKEEAKLLHLKCQEQP